MIDTLKRLERAKSKLVPNVLPTRLLPAQEWETGSCVPGPTPYTPHKILTAFQPSHATQCQ